MVAAVMAAVQAYLDDEAVAEVDEGLPMNPSWRMAAWLPTVDPWASRHRSWTGRGQRLERPRFHI